MAIVEMNCCRQQTLPVCPDAIAYHLSFFSFGQIFVFTDIELRHVYCPRVLVSQLAYCVYNVNSVVYLFDALPCRI